MSKHTVIFEPSGRRGSFNSGVTLLEAARQLGEDIESVCGGKSTCGKCVVRVDDSLFRKHHFSSADTALTPPSDRETKTLAARGFDQGYRLACQARVSADVVVYVPEISRRARQIIRKASIGRPVKVRPALKKYYIGMSPPSLDDLASDADRLCGQLGNIYGLKRLVIHQAAMYTLSAVLRSSEWKVTATVWNGREIVRLEPGRSNGLYGAAVDIGTTTVAVYLCDLQTGQVIGEEAALNPQVKYGEDVITRINYTMNSTSGLAELNHAILECIHKLIASAAVKAGIATGDISEVTVVGNTAMHHIFLGLDPRWIARSPFTPVISSSMDTRQPARSLGLDKSANIHVLPVVAGFVGADTVGAVICEEPHRQDKITLLIDVGTNGEIVLGNKRRLISASCAMGPAFEGGSIRHGMRAAAGAIESVEIVRESLEVRFKVIGNDKWNTQDADIKARGICGSGVIDAVAAMARVGIIEPNGRFNRQLSSDRLVSTADGPAFIIARAEESQVGQDITIGIDDVRAVQLGKAAMHAGIRILMDKLGINGVDRVVLAGAFGSYIRKENAMAIGLFPPCDLKNVYSVGNAAGEGARLALVNTLKRKEAEKIARRIEYIELTVEPVFQKYFVDALGFPAPE